MKMLLGLSRPVRAFNYLPLVRHSEGEAKAEASQPRSGGGEGEG